MTIKTRNHDDRDLLILFLQYQIKKKNNAKLELKHTDSANSSFFGEPKRYPHNLQDSQISLEYKPNPDNNFRNSVPAKVNAIKNDDFRESYKAINNEMDRGNPAFEQSDIKELRELERHFSKKPVSANVYNPKEDSILQRAIFESEVEKTEELGRLKAENQKLKIKNQALIAENDFLNRQKSELLVDQSMINNQNDLVYKDQISNLTQKLKDYRLKSKELEEMLLENENKRLDMRKKIDDLTTSEYEA